MIEIPVRKRGRPKKWNGETIKQTVFLGTEDLAVIRKAFAKTHETSFNAFLVNTILDRSAELEAAARRETYSKSTERPVNAGA